MHNRTADIRLLTRTKSAYNNSSFLKIHSAVDANVVATNDSRHSLAQLLRQHQNQSGWILLVAPCHIPDKEWAEQFQLSLHNVLVVRQKQISDLNATIQQALTSSSCKVVINFACQLEQQQLSACRKLALSNNTWFYQCEQVIEEHLTH
jgi:cell division inhibitor SulA